jgi:hypothetical protein
LIENLELLEHKGKTKTKNFVNDIQSEYIETYNKKYPATSEIMKCYTLVTVIDENEIKEIGMSCMNDLLLDNWHVVLGVYFGRSAQSRFVTLENGSSTNTLAERMTNISDGAVGSVMQFGSGVVPALRSNFKLQTKLQQFNNDNGGWISGLGKVQIGANTVSAFNDNLAETGLFGRWTPEPIGSPQNIMIAHDNISPVVPILMGSQINIDYSMVFS